LIPRPLLNLVATGLTALVAPPAHAATAVDPRDLESLLDPAVTAPTKRAQSVRSVPATVAVLTDREIRERGYLDLVDAMRDLPGVSFMENTLAEDGLNRISFRGMPGNDRVAILLNGRRILGASRPQLDAFYFLHDFPLAVVKRLEVVYGPGSALYGADAMSAVINVVTKDGAEASGVTLEASYGLRGTTSDHLGYGVPLDEDSNLLAFGRFFRSDGEDFERYPAFANSQANRQYWPGSQLRDASQSSDFQLLSFRHQGFSLDFVRRAANTATVGAGYDWRYASNDGGHWLVSTDSLCLDYTAALGELQTSTSLVYDVIALNPNANYFFNVNGDRDVTDPQARGAYVHAYKYGMGRMGRLEETIERTLSPDLDVVCGLVAEDHGAVPETDDLPYPADPNRAISDQGFDPRGLQWIQYQNYGVYGQLQLGYVPGLSTTLGGRFDYNTRYEPTFTPRLGLVYALGPATTLKASYATSYMAPAVTDMYQRWGQPGIWMGFANPDLRPVRGRSAEVGAVQDLGPDRTLTLSLYHNEFTDLIAGKDVAPRLVDGKSTPGTVYQNADAAIMTGADLRLDATFADGLAGTASVSLVDAHMFDAADASHPAREQSISNAVRAMAKAGLTWRPRPGLAISPRLTWLSGRATTADNPEYQGAEIPGGVSLDLAARYELNEHLALHLSGTNLLDQATYGASEDQFTMVPGVPQNGRRLLAGATYTF
jgi:outer membrane receptor protein involved in Fe transport